MGRSRSSCAIVQCALEGVVAVGLELFRHPGRRSEHIKAMKCSRVNVQFGGHAGLYKTLGVIDILVDEQIKCAD